MKKKYKRRKYFVHPLSQGTYIAFSIIPALLTSLFCTYLLVHSGELVLRTAHEKPLVPFYSIRQIILTLEKEHYTEETEQKVGKLKDELAALKNALEASYSETLTQWNRIIREISVMLILFLVLVAGIALLYSHRIAGPLFRINKCINLLSEGKDTGPIVLRKHDHFKELAESLENLRMNMKDKGLLKTEKTELPAENNYTGLN
jgi:methyl-accepting chemotaxis protein